MSNNKLYFGLRKNVFIAGFVSFFMDISPEMIYPLVPLFLANVLGVNKSVIGLIEGIAESTASLLRVFSGWFSDRTGNRKWLMAAGYGISTLSRPIVALATSWHHVMGSRFIDRFGKGIRTAPRDAIIAESSEKTHLGRAFGFHRSMDTLGAVVGPALTFFFLGIFSNNYRWVFWLSMIPGAIAVLLIIFFLTEQKKPYVPSAQRPKLTLRHFDWRKVQRAPGKFFLPVTGMSIDLGGVGKEYAVDRVVKMTLGRGFANGVVDFGQDVFVFGDPPNDAPCWHVGLENPVKPGSCWAGLGVRNAAVTTSGDYVRCFNKDGKRFGHIIDVRTGRPVSNGCRAVSVVAPTCTLAGALSTAAFVLGPEEGLNMLNSTFQAEGCLIVVASIFPPFSPSKR